METPPDPFSLPAIQQPQPLLALRGKSVEHRPERALIDEHRACINELSRVLSAASLGNMVEIARLPENSRGYGHGKAHPLAAMRPKWDRLTAPRRAGRLRVAA